MKALYGVRFLGAVLVMVPTLASTARAVSIDKCSAGKIKCVAALDGASTKCDEGPDKKGQPIDPACTQKASDKYTGGTAPLKGCFAKLEAKPPCDTTGDSAALQEKVETQLSDLFTALDVDFPTAGVDKCAAGKEACADKYGLALFKCYETAALKGTVDPDCLAKAQAKYDGGTDSTKGCFAKLEAKGGCQTTGDSATIAAEIAAYVSDVVCALKPDAGTCPVPALKFGDLTLCNLPILPRLDGFPVRDFLARAENRFGGIVSSDSLADLDTLAADLNAAFDDGVPSAFAQQHLAIDRSCNPANWQSGQLMTFAQSDWSSVPLAHGMTQYDFDHVYDFSDFATLQVGAASRNSVTFDSTDAVFGFLPASGPLAVLGANVFDPGPTGAGGAFGGDVVALRLNVDFSDGGGLRTCGHPGTVGCPWGVGDGITYDQAAWTESIAMSILENSFFSVYANTGYSVDVGDYPNGFSMTFDSPDATVSYLAAASGTPAALDANLIDPTSTSSGVFGGDVLTLLLDVDFSDAGYLPNLSGLKFGDLTMCNLPSSPGFPTPTTPLPGLNGMTVRQILHIAEQALAGESIGYTPAALDPLVAELTAAFFGGEPLPMAAYLFDGPCP